MNPFIRIIPSGLVRAFARPYVAGDSLADAIAVATRLGEGGIAATLDLLAEDIRTADEASRNLATYREIIDAVAEGPFGTTRARPTASLKLSSYTLSPLHEGGQGDGCRDAAFALARYAADKGVDLTIDMESHPWTDFTLRIFSELHAAGHRHVGIVLQTRLHRTERDLDALPEGCRVRLVIGIYDEPDEVATDDKIEMKERLLRAAERLLGRGHYVELATHDEVYVRRFLEEIVPRTGAATDRYEVQMLYGVPRDRLQRELTAQGVLVRLYVPFALGWPMAIAYLRRRLDEYPQMMWLVTKNLVSSAFSPRRAAPEDATRSGSPSP